LVSHQSPLPRSISHSPLGLTPLALCSRVKRLDVALRAVDCEHRVEHDRELLVDVDRAVRLVSPQH
jgi:hypothetical protein